MREVSSAAVPRGCVPRPSLLPVPAAHFPCAAHPPLRLRALHTARYRGMYPSVGGSDEFIRLFLFRKEVSVEEMAALQGKLGGCEEEGEVISLEVGSYSGRVGPGVVLGSCMCRTGVVQGSCWDRAGVVPVSCGGGGVWGHWGACWGPGGVLVGFWWGPGGVLCIWAHASAATARGLPRWVVRGSVATTYGPSVPHTSTRAACLGEVYQCVSSRC